MRLLRSEETNAEMTAIEMWEDKSRPLEDAVAEVQASITLLSETATMMLPQLALMDEFEVRACTSTLRAHTKKGTPPRSSVARLDL